MYKKGYIYKGLKPVYWCPKDETALAEAEIEYQTDKCTSIYVKFKVADDKGKLSSLTDLSKTYFVIWTTTTWTLPGNLAIALNPDEEYGYQKYASPVEFQQALAKLYRSDILPQIKKGLCGAILTQLSDVEDETNGLVTYDRMVVKADREEMRKIAQDIKVLSSEG